MSYRTFERGLIKEVEDVMLGALKYIESKFENGGKIIADIHKDQFVYGHTKDDENDKLYFIDIEPRFIDYDLEKDRYPDGWSSVEGETYGHFYDIYISILKIFLRNLLFLEEKSNKNFVRFKEALKDMIVKYEDNFHSSIKKWGGIYHDSYTRRERIKDLKELKNQLDI
jgi:hypothetical protein